MRKRSINRCVHKAEGVDIHHAVLPSHRKNETTPLAATSMDPDIIIPSEGSQTERGKYI